MDWINEHIAIGNRIEAEDVDLLRREGIRSIVSLDGQLKATDTTRLGVEAIEAMLLIDGPGNDLRMFRRAVAAVGQFVEKSSPVLVHCTAGRSRSPSVVAGYMVAVVGLEPEEALAQIAAKREIYVDPALMALVEKLYWDA